METKTVLVTGMGGNVGQGIVRNILSAQYPIKIIGTNILKESAGNHLVDVFFQVPFGYEPEFIPTIIDIVKREKVDLIIPSTDFEMSFLVANQHKIPCKIAGGGSLSTEIYLDKYLTSVFHSENNIPFAKTLLPSEFKGEFSPAIAKPRKGRGSKGIIKNFKNDVVLADEDYIVQQQIIGKEITTAAYVSYLTGELLGIISMERSLENGATTYCKVVQDYDVKFKEIALAITQKTDVKGSFNIQSMVSEQGEVYPFEINCRISGTNSVRSHFGFPDVLFTIDELLYQKMVHPPKISIGVAFRYLADVIYPEGPRKGNNNDNFTVF